MKVRLAIAATLIAAPVSAQEWTAEQMEVWAFETDCAAMSPASGGAVLPRGLHRMVCGEPSAREPGMRRGLRTPIGTTRNLLPHDPSQ